MNRDMNEGTCLTCYNRDGGVCYSMVCNYCKSHQPCSEVSPDERCINYEEHPYGSYETWLEEHSYEAEFFKASFVDTYQKFLEQLNAVSERRD